eukprot:GHVN01037175.1.p1 GENE.GHVN01037175.1~~GHVN01037175.1.p1  ORF type:complete len:369 (+),score=67.19 GHVN01037175.1:1159-2265(+)
MEWMSTFLNTPLLTHQAMVDAFFTSVHVPAIFQPIAPAASLSLNCLNGPPTSLNSHTSSNVPTLLDSRNRHSANAPAPPLNKQPVVVSWLIPVHNEEKFLEMALNSVSSQLNPSSLTWECVVVDDCSTDSTCSIVEAHKKQNERFRLVRMTERGGVGCALRAGVLYCLGKYVMRLDGDDIAMNDRMITQVRFMETHPSIDVAGSAFESFTSLSQQHDSDGSSVDLGNWVFSFPCNSFVCGWSMLFECCVAHPTVVIRRDALECRSPPLTLSPLTDDLPPSSPSPRLNYIDEPAEDHGLWLRMLDERCKVANMGLILTRVRRREGSVTSVRGSQLKRSSIQSVARRLSRLLSIGPKITEDSVALLWGTK